MAIYYLDGSTLLTSTGVFTDEQMTTCATDGFYSDGVNSRELVNCTLLPPVICPTCATPCGGSIAGSGTQGIYLLDLDTGSTASDVGAVIITFNPASIPDGIRATFNSTIYNKVSSPIDGYHGSTSANNFTFIGDSSSDCGLSGSTYPALTEYNYVGGSFVATGNTQSLSVAAGDVSLGSAAPGNCVMVIPKQTAEPSIVNFEFVGPCSSTAWSITVSCPALLTSFSSSETAAASSNDACNESLTVNYYNAPVTGTAGVPDLYDWVFSDAYGSNVLPSGFYETPTKWIEVDTNGIVVDTGTCSSPIPYYIYLSDVELNCNNFCGSTNYIISSQRQTDTNHQFADITVGDVIQGVALQNGHYAYSGPSTDTNTGIFRIMELDGMEVVSISQCSGGVCVLT